MIILENAHSLLQLVYRHSIQIIRIKYWFSFQILSNNPLMEISLEISWDPDHVGTPLYKLNRYVLSQRVWFLCRFGLKTGMECFHPRGHPLYKFIGTNKRVCIRRDFNYHRICLGHQHVHCLIVLGHQYGRRHVMWKTLHTLCPFWSWNRVWFSRELPKRMNVFIILMPNE